MNEKLQTYFGYKGLDVRRAYHRNYEKTLPENKYPLEDNNILFGLEIEVENISKIPEFDFYWRTVKDGSLRNNGREFVSIPLRANQIEPALLYLKDRLAFYGNDYKFSPRTSVHIHMNVRDFTWDRVKTFVLLYAIFEKHFFHLVGKVRENNIFCVPLYKTNQLWGILQLEECNKWHKYNALNLACIYGDDDVKRYGTVEFRHLYGTLDINTIITWINNIECLHKYSKVVSLEQLVETIKELNTTSEYVTLYQTVFGEHANIRTMMKKDFEFCISSTKKAIWGKDKNYLYMLKFDSAYYDHMKLIGEV